jgi:hypothetical protein
MAAIDAPFYSPYGVVGKTKIIVSKTISYQTIFSDKSFGVRQV